MKKLIIILASAFLTNEGFSQDLNVLSSAGIPVALKENAHSIKREEKINFDVSDIDAAKLSVHQVITVLDAQGEDELYFYEYSSAFRKLNDAEIKVYDANGKFVNKYKLKEMHAESMGEGLVEDGKIYFYQ